MKIKLNLLQIGLALFLAGCFFVFQSNHTKAGDLASEYTYTLGDSQARCVSSGGCAVDISNGTLDGGQPLNWTTSIEPGRAWLSIRDGGSGSNCKPEDGACARLTYNVTPPAGATAGWTQTANVTISCNGTGCPQIVTVKLTILAAGTAGGTTCYVSINSNPASINPGQSSTITWGSRGCATVSVTGPDSFSNSSLDGSQSIVFSSVGEYVYTISGADSQGRPADPVSTKVSVTAGSGGSITDCTVSIQAPTAIPIPAYVNVKWTSKNCTTVHVTSSRGNLDSPSPEGQADVYLTGTTTFTITGSKPPAAPVTASKTVLVGDTTPGGVGAGWVGCSVKISASPQALAPGGRSAINYSFTADLGGYEGCKGNGYVDWDKPAGQANGGGVAWLPSFCDPTQPYMAETDGGPPTEWYSCTTPILTQVGTYTLKAAADGYSRTGFDPVTGEERWELSLREVSTNIIVGTDDVYVCTLKINYNVVDNRSVPEPPEPPNQPFQPFQYRLSGQSIIEGTGYTATYNRTAANENWIASLKDIGNNPDFRFDGITPSPSQSCVTGQNTTLTFTYNFTTEPPPPPSKVTALNSNPTSGVACGQIKVSWDAIGGANSYKLYRSTTTTPPGTELLTTNNNFHNDSSVVIGTTYYYWVKTVNSSGSDSAYSTRSIGVAPSPCRANFVNRSKLVNGGNVTGLRVGDTVTLSINVPNDGTLNATNVVVRDDLTNTNLAFDTTFTPTITVNGVSAGSYTRVGNLLTFNMGTIPAFKSGTITFRAKLTAPVGNTQPQLRMRNVGNITFSTSLAADNAGCVGTGTNAANPCVADTGYIVFSTGVGTPNQHETNPYQ
jgi:uncharacterized repeat protein (TIGR01451 family)